MDRGVDTFLVHMDDDRKAGASTPLMSDGQLKLGLVEGQAFLAAGDWIYPLMPEHVCLRMGPRFYVFDTEDDSHAAEGCELAAEGLRCGCLNDALASCSTDCLCPL